jgi:hypothetical protein
MTMSLSALRVHNALEHDGSLVHPDVSEEECEAAKKDGRKVEARWEVDQGKLEDFLCGGCEGGERKEELTFEDLSRVRAKRNEEARELAKRLKRIAGGETVLVYLTLGRFDSQPHPSTSTSDTTPLLAPESESSPKADLGGRVTAEDAQAWLGEDRLPDGWTGNRRGKITNYGEVKVYGEAVAEWIWKHKKESKDV